MDFMVTGVLTGRRWDMHILSCPSHNPTGIEIDYTLYAQQQALRSLLCSIITKLWRHMGRSIKKESFLEFHGYLISNCWIIFVWRSPKMYINFEFLLQPSQGISWILFFLKHKKLREILDWNIIHFDIQEPHLHNQFSKAETYLQNVLASPGLHIVLTNASA